MDFEESLKSIYNYKKELENNLAKTRQNLDESNTLKNEANNEVEKSKLKSEKLIDESKEKSIQLLLDTKKEISKIIRQANNNTDLKQLNNLRNTINQKIKSFTPTENNFCVVKNTNQINIEDIKKGCNVFVTTLGQPGIILSNISKDNEVQVQVGSIKTTINIKNLENLKIDTNKQANLSTSFSSNTKFKKISTEINVIGMNVEEALPIVDKFLDDSSLAKLQTVSIIHGKGSGKLRNGIHNFLKNHPHVKNYRIGTFGEGEMGVTVVEIK